MDNKVLDEAVEVALSKMPVDVWNADGADYMRAALLAALPVLLGEPVAWQARNIDPEEGPGMWSGIEERHVELVRCNRAFEVRALYAPSLGEGDGR